MDERDIAGWENYLSGNISAEERHQIEERLGADPLYKDRMLAFMLLNDALAAVTHTPAIQAEVGRLLDKNASRQKLKERRMQFPTPFGALFYKRTKRELWTVFGAAAFLCMVVAYWFSIPDEAVYAKVEYKASDGNAFNKHDDPNAITSDSVVVAFYDKGKYFWRFGAEYEWAGDTLNIYRLSPKSEWYILPSVKKGIYVLRAGDKMYTVKKGQKSATKLDPLR